MPQDLLEEEDNAWFDAWKASGIDQEVFMPYFSQFDNESGTGYRECFSSAAAMVAAFYKKVKRTMNTTLFASNMATPHLLMLRYKL